MNSPTQPTAGTTADPSSRLRSRSLAWFVAGCGAAIFLLVTQAFAVGGPAGMLLVGDRSELRPFIESFLGPVPVVPGGGHDGQIYFAIAHDLDGDVVSSLIDNPGIRYRRPLLPVLASLGGLIEGKAVLALTFGWLVLGFGVSAAAFRELLARSGAGPIWMAALFVYPGFWEATRLLTPDMLALGLVLCGLLLALQGKTMIPVIAFAAAAVTKEVFVVVALSTGAWMLFRRKRGPGLAIAVVPTVVVAVCATLAISRFDAPVVDGNFGFPFAGILAASSVWPNTSTLDRGYVVVTLCLLAASVAALWLARSSIVRLLIIPWPLIGLISSDWIWSLGNGTIRSFAPLSLFVALAVAERVSGRQISNSYGSSTRPLIWDREAVATGTSQSAQGQTISLD